MENAILNKDQIEELTALGSCEKLESKIYISTYSTDHKFSGI